MKVLVSGTGSGLGRFLQGYFAAAGFDRHAATQNKRHDSGLVIHAACGPAPRDAHGAEADEYVARQVTLCERMIAVPHQRFIYVSSVDIYQGQQGEGQECTDIAPSLLPSAYARMKYECEQLVLANAVAPIILRPSALLGTDMRPNGAMRMLRAPSEALTLAAHSCFNYVSHKQVASLIDRLLDAGAEGIFNVASTHGVTLGQIAAHYGCDPQFGAYQYQTPAVDNRKAAQYLPDLEQDSLALFVRFWAEYTAQHT